MSTEEQSLSCCHRSRDAGEMIFQQFGNFGAVQPYIRVPSKRNSNSLPVWFSSCPVYTGLDSRGTCSSGLNLLLQKMFSASEEVWHRFLEVGSSHFRYRTCPLDTLKPEVVSRHFWIYSCQPLPEQQSLSEVCEVCAEEHSINSVLPIRYGHTVLLSPDTCCKLPHRNLKPGVVKELYDWADNALFLRFYLLYLFGPSLCLLATSNEN